MFNVSKNQLDNFILKEARKVILEQDEENTSFEETMKRNTDDEIKRIQTFIKARQASAGQITDPEMRKALNAEVNSYRAQLTKNQNILKSINKQIEDKKNLIKKTEEMKKNQAKGEETPAMQVVASTVMETVISQPEEQPESAPILKRKFAFQEAQNVLPRQQIQPQTRPIIQQPKPKKKSIIVQFDRNTKQPFNVTFSMRGFAIGDTRLSFELIEKAISKKFTITLENGFVLDNIKMQKILKYKDVMFNF